MGPNSIQLLAWMDGWMDVWTPTILQKHPQNQRAKLKPEASATSSVGGLLICWEKICGPSRRNEHQCNCKYKQTNNQKNPEKLPLLTCERQGWRTFDPRWCQSRSGCRSGSRRPRSPPTPCWCTSGRPRPPHASHSASPPCSRRWFPSLQRSRIHSHRLVMAVKTSDFYADVLKRKAVKSECNRINFAWLAEHFFLHQSNNQKHAAGLSVGTIGSASWRKHFRYLRFHYCSFRKTQY